MALKFYNESDIQAIASAIRAKNGLSNTYKVSQMASAILDIPSGGGGGGNTDIEDGLITRTLSTCENSRVTIIGSSAFYRCSALTSINFPLVTTIGEYAFNMCSSLMSVSFPLVTTIGHHAFQMCSSLISISFPLVITIRDGAFSYCRSLSSISFPLATTLGSGAFQVCNSLTSINFPLVTTIGSWAFTYCSNLTSVNFLLVTTVGSHAFRSCNALSSVELGGGESQSGLLSNTCFSDCYNLIGLTLLGSHIYELMNSNAFTSTPIGGYSISAKQYGSIYVPASLYSLYISATNWVYFSSRIMEDLGGNPDPDPEIPPRT